VALAYAVVAHGNAQPWRTAAEAAADLRTDLGAAIETHGPAVQYLVVDPPDARRGVQPVGDALPWLVHPALDASKPEEAAAWPAVRSLSTDAFLALVHEPEFVALLDSTVVVLVPEDEGPEPGRVVHRAFPLTAGAPTDGPRSWRDTLGSPGLNLNPRTTGALVVTARPGTDLATLERLTWTTAVGADRQVARAGVWFEDGDEIRGVYDLSRLLDWHLGTRVRGLFFEDGERPLSLVEVRDELPPLRGGLQAEVEDEGRTWIFAPVTEDLVLSGLSRGHFVLGLLDLERFGHCEVDVTRTPAGVLRARLPERGSACRLVEGAGDIVWTLEFRIDDRAVARNRGRLAATDR